MLPGRAARAAAAGRLLYPCVPLNRRQRTFCQAGSTFGTVRTLHVQLLQDTCLVQAQKVTCTAGSPASGQAGAHQGQPPGDADVQRATSNMRPGLSSLNLIPNP